MRMQATPRQSFNLANGAQYFADDDGVIEEVALADVGEMRRVGARLLPWPLTAAPVTPPPAAAEPAIEEADEPAAEPSEAVAEAEETVEQ